MNLPLCRLRIFILAAGWLAFDTLAEPPINAPGTNRAPLQVNIRAKFIEVTEPETRVVSPDWDLGNYWATNTAIITNFPASVPASDSVKNESHPDRAVRPLTGILTDPQFRIVLRAMDQRNGANFLAAAEVTTVSGQRAHIQMVNCWSNSFSANGDPIIVTTNGTTNYIFPIFPKQPIPLEFTLEATANVLPDGYTIQMKIIASMNEFPAPPESATNTSRSLPQPRTQQISMSANAWDSQTIFLGGMTTKFIKRTKTKVPVLGSIPLLGRSFRRESSQTMEKQFFVFITPTLLDSSGHRLHTDEDMPFALNSVPSQSAALESRK